MPSPANPSTAKRRGFWLSIARTLLVEVFVLILLSGAIVGYLKWSSDSAWAEFNAVGKLTTPGPKTPIQAVRYQTTCYRRA